MKIAPLFIEKTENKIHKAVQKIIPLAISQGGRELERVLANIIKKSIL